MAQGSFLKSLHPTFSFYFHIILILSHLPLLSKVSIACSVLPVFCHFPSSCYLQPTPFFFLFSLLLSFLSFLSRYYLTACNSISRAVRRKGIENEGKVGKFWRGKFETFIFLRGVSYQLSHPCHVYISIIIVACRILF